MIPSDQIGIVLADDQTNVLAVALGIAVVLMMYGRATRSRRETHDKGGRS